MSGLDRKEVSAAVAPILKAARDGIDASIAEIEAKTSRSLAAVEARLDALTARLDALTVNLAAISNEVAAVAETATLAFEAASAKTEEVRPMTSDEVKILAQAGGSVRVLEDFVRGSLSLVAGKELILANHPKLHTFVAAGLRVVPVVALDEAVDNLARVRREMETAADRLAAARRAAAEVLAAPC